MRSEYTTTTQYTSTTPTTDTPGGSGNGVFTSLVHPIHSPLPSLPAWSGYSENEI